MSAWCDLRGEEQRETRGTERERERQRETGRDTGQMWEKQKRHREAEGKT